MCRLIERSYRKLWLTFIMVSILVFNCINVLIVPDFYFNVCEHCKECKFGVPFITPCPNVSFENKYSPSKKGKSASASQREFHKMLMMMMNVPDLDRFSHHDIDNLIWSNESVPLLSPKNACPQGPNTAGPEILIMVPSALVNLDRRIAIRDSWANTSAVRSGKVKVIFVIGQTWGASATSQVGSCRQMM